VFEGGGESVGRKSKEEDDIPPSYTDDLGQPPAVEKNKILEHYDLPQFRRSTDLDKMLQMLRDE